MELTERQNLSALNVARHKDKNQKALISSNSGAGPNKTTYVLVGMAAFLGDLLTLIPLVGFVVSFPFFFMLWLWKEMGGHKKTDSTKKLINNGLARLIPISFANTIFVVSTYLEAKKSFNK